MNNKMKRLVMLCKRVGFIAIPVSLVWWFINVNKVIAAYESQGYRVPNKSQFVPYIYDFTEVGRALFNPPFDVPLLRSGMFWIGLVALVTWGVLAYINAQEETVEITGEAPLDEEGQS